jgi:hypothetical protein
MPRQEYPSLRQGLVGAWCPSLGATGLSLIDRSGRNNHGVLTNMGGQDNWRASGSGVALNFDGTNDFVAVANNKTLRFGLGPFAFSAWIRANPISQFGLISQIRMDDDGITNVIAFSVGEDTKAATAGKKFGLGIFFNGTLAYRWADASKDVITGDWQHVCAVWDGSDAKLYSSGNDVTGVSQTLGSVSSLAPTGPLRLGANVATGGNYFSGQIDDFRIYNRALTLAEIRLLASRRGIGLSPLPDRGGGLPRKLSVNVGGSWRAADSYINVGGTWKLGQASTNVAGTWR